MKNLIIEMLQKKQLSNKKLDILLSSGNKYTFDLSTDKIDLCTGHDYLMFTQNERKIAISCKYVEMFVIS